MRNYLLKSGVIALTLLSWSGFTFAETKPPIISEPVIKNLGEGTSVDVTWSGSKVWVVAKQGTKINLYSGTSASDLAISKSFNLPDSSGVYPRITVSGNTIWVAYRDGNNLKLWRRDTSQSESIPGVDGSSPALGEDMVAWQGSDSNFTVYIRPLSGGQASEVKPGTPTGISRIYNGDVISNDYDLNFVPWGTVPALAGNLTVAQGQNGGTIGRFDNDASKEFKIFGNQISFSPRVAVSGDKIAVATWGSSGTGVRVATFSSSLVKQDPKKTIPPFAPGASFTAPTDGLPTDLGSLIVSIFLWSFRILGVVIFVRFFWAGFMWFTAAGNTGTIGQAQNIMRQAALGAFILFAAYLILFTILLS
ncbi:hypothetical protein KW791_04035, partial [Candidatus Parcubacteria bacterium]|nr:hypothetical protein [Candidatus Parcubacteria bacterium]